MLPDRVERSKSTPGQAESNRIFDRCSTPRSNTKWLELSLYSRTHTNITYYIYQLYFYFRLCEH
jgi:hypothetical protein